MDRRTLSIVDALMQSNFEGVLPAEETLGQPRPATFENPVDGSAMFVLTTDAPLSDRNLTRLARRGLAGLARTGAGMAGGSGDYAIAFSTHESVRRTPERRGESGHQALGKVWAYPEVHNKSMSPLFQAAIEATEEAIYNSLTMATTVTGYRGRTVEALPLERVLALVDAK